MKTYSRQFRATTVFTRSWSIALSLFLVFAACGTKNDKTSSGAIEAASAEQAKRDLAASQQWTESDGVIAGAWTLNGQNIALKHAYARRYIYEDKRPVIEIVLADNQVSAEALTALFADDEERMLGYGKPFTGDTGMLSATSTNALLFRIPKDFSSAVYFESALTADDLLYPISVSSNDFEEFDLNNGVITAKVQNEVDESVQVPDAVWPNTRETNFKYSYALSFPARLAKAPATASSGDSPPDEGTATGELDLEGSVSVMKYSYARRERIFFDEPETIVHVLITDEAVPKEHLGSAFKDGFLPDGLKIKGIHLKTDHEGALKKYSVREWGVSVAISIGGSADELTVKELAAGKDRATGRVAGSREFSKQSFSVTFDAPL